MRARAETEQVTQFWRRLALPGLIDLHVHFMPEQVLRKVRAHFDRVGLMGGQRWPIHYREPQDEAVQLLRAFGLRAFPSLLYAHKPAMAEWLNDWAAAFAAQVPECVRSATFFPEEGVDRYVAAALEGGARVWKVHLQVGSFDPRAAVLRPVWRRLEEARVPVVVHAGSGPEPGPFTGPGPFSQVIEAHPELVAIIAHMGAPEYASFLDLALRHPNVHLDVTMVFTDFMSRLGAPFPPALVPRLAEHPERVVLGTDFPNIPYDYAHQLDALEALGLGEDWLRAVCYDNGARLLGLPPRVV